ncbi:MAG: OmpA family protein [Myxococcales bacterium]|nr:OmpA family protein [Myxococcales bacterium]
MNYRFFLFATALLILPATAEAQGPGVTLDQFRTAETVDDGFALSRPNDAGHMKFGAHLTFDYANDPLVFERITLDAMGNVTGRTETDRAVANHLVGSLSLHLGIADRLILFTGVPLTLWMDGDSGVTGGPPADGTGLGDPWLGARLRLLGAPEDFFGLGLQAHVTFPVAHAIDGGQAYLGERGMTFTPELLAELRLPFVQFTGNLGIQLREQATFGDLTIGNELRWGVGATVPLVTDRLNAHVELYGSTPLGSIAKFSSGSDITFGTREASPMELLFGGKYHAPSGFVVGLAGGPGLLRGYGSPDMRLVGQLGFSPPEEVPEPPRPQDTDGDGLDDNEDACPTEPEDMDDFQDEDGCPDPDNDEDGVLDGEDACPTEAEDLDSFEDDNGCPDPDNDGDGIADSQDECPLDAEDMDSFEDENGCPDPDNDGDSIVDGEDACPTAPGAPSDKAEENGCPKAVRVDEEKGQIVILERVEFAVGKDRILKASFPLLEEMRNTIAANKRIKKLRVEGHTDDRGADKANMDLSKRRAGSVLRWLVENGIEDARLEAYGCGETMPLGDNKTVDGRQTNRRVEFHIVDPAPANPRPTGTCELVE